MRPTLSTLSLSLSRRLCPCRGRLCQSPSHGTASKSVGILDSPRVGGRSLEARHHRTPCHGLRGGENHNVGSSSVSYLVEGSLRVRMSRTEKESLRRVIYQSPMRRVACCGQEPRPEWGSAAGLQLRSRLTRHGVVVDKFRNGKAVPCVVLCVCPTTTNRREWT